MSTVTLNSMAFDNFETVNDTLLADFDGAGLYSAIVGGIDRGLEWGANGAAVGGALGAGLGAIPAGPTAGISIAAGTGIGAAGGALLFGTAGFITGAIDNY